MLAKDEAFALVKERLAAGKPIKESEVQAFISARFEMRHSSPTIRASWP